MTDFPLSLPSLVFLRAFLLALVFLPAFIPLLFINLPVAATLELMTLTSIIYLVILPSSFGGWAALDSSNAESEIKKSPGATKFCGDQLDACTNLFYALYQLPVNLTSAMVGAVEKRRPPLSTPQNTTPALTL